MNTQENNKTIAQVIKTQQNNKMIAEFMKHSHPFLPSKSTINYTAEDLDYDNDWNWLMPVVERIEQVHEGVPQELIHLSLFSTRDEVYNAVVEFINEYNKNK